MARYSSQRLMVVLSLSFAVLSGCDQPIKPYPSSKAASRSIKMVSIVGEAGPEDSEDIVKADYTKAALANVELGLGYLSQGQIPRAKQKLTHAIQLAPHLAESHAAMAFFLERVGDYQEAENEHKKAIKSTTFGQNGGGVRSGSVYNNYGAFLCRRGRLGEAEQSFQRALQDKQYPHMAEVYENAGLCAVQTGNVKRAEQYFSKAVQQDPKRSTALLELVDIKLKTQELEKAKAFLNQYQGIAEPTARSTWLGLQVSEALEDEEAVAKQAMLLQNLFGDSAEYQQYLNTKLRTLGKARQP